MLVARAKGITRSFAQQIEWSLFTGAIKCSQILTLYQQLQLYLQGTLSEAAMQSAIDDIDPELAVEPHWKENPLDFSDDERHLGSMPQ